MITFCQMTQNRLSETAACVERYLPYVDRVVIVDGGSIDDTVFYFRNWAQQEPKIEYYLSPWKDDFSWQRNNYLDKVQDNTWALVSDPDELFEEETLKALPALIELAESKNMNMVGFQCRSVSYKGPERVWESLDNYWKRLLFKKVRGAKYVGNPHEGLNGFPHRIMDTKYIYEHIKQENVIWHRGARNMFCGGGGPNLGRSNERWIRLRRICNDLNLRNWHDYEKYLLKGDIDQRVKDWMIEHKDVDGWDGASEHREMYKLYFEVYHPEEQ